MRWWCACALVLAVAAMPLPAAPAAERDVRVALVVQVGCWAPFEQTLCRAFGKAVRAAGIEGTIVVPSTRETLEDTLSALARQPYALVIAGGTLLVDALEDVAGRFPDRRFAILDVRHEVLAGRPANVQGVVAETHEAAFLAGFLAGRLEAARPGPDIAGAVGGARIPSVEELILGYRAGVLHANPRARVLVGYSQTFLNPRRCRAIASRQIAKGAGVVFNVAGGCGLGTLRAAKERDVWGIGVDEDQSFLGSHILTSVVKNFEPLLRRLAVDVASGRVRTGGTTELGLAAGAAGLGAVSPAVPREIVAELARVRARLVAGTIDVPRVRR